MSKVLSRKQLPTKPPVMGTAFWLVVLDKYHAPGWVWGGVVTVLVIFWIALIVVIVREEQVELEELK